MSDDKSWVGIGNWQDVASGLRQYFVFAIVSVVFSVLLMLVTVAMVASNPHNAIELGIDVGKYGGIIGLAIALFGLLAIERYSHIGQASGARGTAKAAFAFGVLSFLLSAATIIKMWVAPPESLEAMQAPNWLDISARLVGVLQVFFFLASMKTCATFIQRFDLASLAGNTMVLAGIVVALAVLVQVVGTANPMVVVLFGLGMLGIGIWCLVWLLMLVSRLAKSVLSDTDGPAAFS